MQVRSTPESTMEQTQRVTELEEKLLRARNELKNLRQTVNTRNTGSGISPSGKEELKNSIIDNIHYPLLVLDEDLRVVFANKKYYKEYGSKVEKIDGELIYDLGNGQWNISQLKKILETTLLTKSSMNNFELKYKNDEGQERYICLNASEIHLKESPGKYIMLSIEDQTEKKLAEIRLKESQHKYKEMIHSSTSLIAILKGPEMIIETANKSIKKVWGKGDNVEGRSLFEVLPEINEQGMPELFEKVYKTGQPYTAKERPIKHEVNGKLVPGYYNFIYQPQRNLEGEIVGVSVIANDVTKQALLNRKIRKSEREFRELVNFMPHKINMADPDGNVIFYNKSWLDYAGKELDEFLAEPWPLMIHPDEREQVVEEVDHCLKTGCDLEMELRIEDKNGDYKWHLCRATPVIDDEGNINSWLASSTEIQKLKEEEQRKEDFLKLVSHELKTPVTSIKGYVQLLLSSLQEQALKELNTPVKPYLKRIEGQVERLIRLISEMLDLSRIEQNELELQKTEFNLNEHVEELVEDLKYSNKDIEIEIQNDCDCDVVADRDRIGQVIINFVTNALKYTPDGNRVEIRVFNESPDNVAVTVKDFGIGIDEKEQQQIFKRFYRVSGNKDDTYAGFGIGLYLSSKIIERHNGKIMVNSAIGEGSEFTFTLPINQN
ncbi:PAS domain-containing sensor histidine kinase [Christiangramia sabulilitoris]|uniref:histidine kinase n=1 Tax=Christiangramia sabulilitoris TaxID=2583991 RepID=A0A550I644_9FLAO|nr:PAS domain-containing sensor histidine kinase [Christiangramia sabulilitoris]TRO66446.1 PAS domain S-box protein [Christiangramia sabulilitoris]